MPNQYPGPTSIGVALKSGIVTTKSTLEVVGLSAIVSVEFLGIENVDVVHNKKSSLLLLPFSFVGVEDGVQPLRSASGQ